MKVLIADDERNIRNSITDFLNLEKIASIAVENGLAAKRMLENNYFDAAILDLRMPGLDGLALLEWIRTAGPAVPVVMISAHGDVNDAVRAMKLGAEDYLIKPFDPEELLIRLKKIFERRLLLEKYEAGRRSFDADAEVIGQSEAMRAVFEIAGKAAPTDSTVLLTGESGTGKEAVARLIHRQSRAPDQPFIAVNVASIPETLLESELFGYEKGAFTGAAARKLGLIELAASGTVLLDEIGDMPPHLQVKLLRVIQDHKIQRLGGTESLPVSARFIAATNKNLESLVENGIFREDLFYRLNVIRIHVPPLRERRKDIAPLAGYLVQKIGKRLGKTRSAMTPEAIAVLQDYRFPGNVRELENVIERALILGEDERITTADLGIAPAETRMITPVSGTLRELEKQAIEAALKRWDGNRTRTAEELGITRKTLQNKIREYGLEIVETDGKGPRRL